MFGNLPRDIIYNHIIVWYPLDWIRVNKQCNSYAAKNLLSDPRIDVNRQIESSGECHIYIAIKNGYICLAKLLLKDENLKLSNLSHDLVKVAIKYNQKEIAEMILDDPRYTPINFGSKRRLRNIVNEM